MSPDLVWRVPWCAEGSGEGDSVQAGRQDRHQGRAARALHL